MVEDHGKSPDAVALNHSLLYASTERYVDVEKSYKKVACTSKTGDISELRDESDVATWYEQNEQNMLQSMNLGKAESGI